MGKYFVFDVGIFDIEDNEIDEVNITAKSEKKMWDIFDKYYKDNYPNYHTAGIYDCTPC